MAILPGCPSRAGAGELRWDLGRLSTLHLFGVPSWNNPGVFIACQSLCRLSTDREAPARRSIDVQGAPGRNPHPGEHFPHTIKKHFVLNKTRQSIYIPQLGRTLLILPVRGEGKSWRLWNHPWYSFLISAQPAAEPQIFPDFFFSFC
jgi:hypothetical protein